MFCTCILAIEDESDREYMEQLFLQYERLMYSEISKILKNRADVEDVLQLSLVKMIDKLQILRSRSRDQLINYIISICKNTAISWLRKKSKIQFFQLDEDWDSFRDTESDLFVEELTISKIEIEQLIKNWTKLDDRTRFLLEGRYILEKTDQELASDLGIKPASVRMALVRARKAAFDMLKDSFETKD